MLLRPVTGRPLPTTSWLTQPFWDAAREGRLIVQQCSDCGKRIFRPEAACTACLCEDLEWVESPGLGRLHSYSIVMRPAVPEMEAPYVVAIVEMDDRWYMMTNIIGCEETEVRSEMALEVQFVEIGGLHLPFFQPRGRHHTDGRHVEGFTDDRSESTGRRPRQD